MKSEPETWLVAVGAGRWQLSGIRAAMDLGIKVLALDGNADAPGLELADMGLVVDIVDSSAVINSVKESGITPSGAIAFVNESGMRSAAALRDEFNMPGPSAEVIYRLTNKVAQRVAWQKAGLPCPRWSAATNLAAVTAAVRDIGGRVIIKPADSAGSRGISVVNNNDDAMLAGEKAIAGSMSGQAIIEAFIVGTEYTVESFGSLQDGHQVLAVTRKRKVSGSADTVAMELATEDISEPETAAIAKLAARALSALGYNDGPGHTEIIRMADGALFLVEAAGRSGGFMVNDGLIPRTSSFDMSKACALQAVGQTVPFFSASNQATVLRFLPSRPGVVESFSGFEEANRIDGIESAPLVTVGDTVGRAESDSDRLAYILTWDVSAVVAQEKADLAESIINVEVDTE